MSYSGVQPTFGTFPSDLFTGNGSNTVFTMSSVPGNKAALLISIDGVRQHTDTYSYSANTLSFSEAPPSGAIIEAINMGSRADVVVTDGVYRKSQFTATAAQTNFNIATGYTIGFVDVYLNGIRLVVGDDYTANDGSTIILAVAAAAGDAVEVVAYGTFNVANALLKSGDTMSGNLVVSGTSIMATPHAIANTTGNTVVFANTGVVTFNANTIHVGAATFSNTLTTNGQFRIVESPTGYGVRIRTGNFVQPGQYGSHIYIEGDAGSDQRTMKLSTTYVGSTNGGVAFDVSSSDTNATYGSDQTTSAYTSRFRVDALGRMTTPTQPCLLMKATGSGSFTVPTATYTKVAVFNSTAYSRGNLSWDATNSRVTVPTTGVYLISYGSAFQSGGYPGNDWLIPLYVNGVISTFVSGDATYSTGFNSAAMPAYPMIQKTFIVPLNANDYVEMYMYQDSGSTRTIYADFSFFQIALLG